MVLIHGLPRESLLVRKKQGIEYSEWTVQAELQAATVDLLNVLIRAQIQNPPPFEPVPRPWQDEKETPNQATHTLADLSNILKGN